MKKTLLIILACVLASCKCTNLLGSNSLMNIKQNDKQSNNLFFVSTSSFLYGFDSTTFEQKVKIQFNTHIAYGDKAEDGRLIIADQGSNAGSYGTRLLVLDKKYNLLREIETNPTPTDAQIIGGHIFVGAATMVTGSKYSLQIFNENTYSLEKELHVDNIIIRDNFAKRNDNLFISVGNYRAADSVAPYILKGDLTNLNFSKFEEYKPNYKKARIFSSLFDGVLIVTTPALVDSFHIAAIDLKTGTTISTIKLDTFPSILAGYGESILLPPCSKDGKLYYILQETIYPSKRCKLICLSYPELSVESVKELNFDFRLVAFDYYYLNPTTLVIYSKDNGLGVISVPDGTLLKHADLE